MSSQASSSSSSFELLHPSIQEWVWSQGWTSLRDAQEWAVPALVHADRDVIVAASTAAGKTEAAFLPILTNLISQDGPAGAVLYISPLKALINDQWDRLTRLCERIDLPVVAWHGDIGASKKQKFLKSPRGILLITPESLEALFVNRGTSLPGLFQHLRYIVIDELHAFIGTERGKQLQSLMQRVELIVGKPVSRVGLSATLGQMSLAQAFLRPLNPDGVEIIESKSSGLELRIQVRGYIDASPKRTSPTPSGPPPNAQHVVAVEEDSVDAEHRDSANEIAIAEHLYKVLRGANNLIFPNSRTKVERYADRLRKCCERDGIANEFWPHHGSLSKDLREDTERALKAGTPPASAVCTTTLELGIDIGSIKTVAQIGSPPSVASLRQRLGRSGRRAGEAATLRGYCQERSLTADSSLSDQLREGLVQTIAMIRLLMQGWFEPPRSQGMHASTLVQQTLSVIAQLGGATAPQLWKTLVASGTFTNITQPDFLTLLKSLGEKDLIVQESSGLLLPGEKGERMLNHYEFYSAFTTEEEFRLVQGGRPLGSLPISSPLAAGQRIIFGGRRWQVLQIDLEAKVIVVIPARGGQAPAFDGLSAQVHKRVREEMRLVLSEDAPCPFLDATAQMLLTEARQNFQALSLAAITLIASESHCYLVSWEGDTTNDTLALMLSGLGLRATNEGFAINIDSSEGRLVQALETIATFSSEQSDRATMMIENQMCEKWDWALPKDLLRKSYASLALDFPGAIALARQTVMAN